MSRLSLRLPLLLALGLALAACSSDRKGDQSLAVVKDLVTPNRKPVPPSPTEVANYVAKALTLSNEPLMLMSVEETKTITVMRPIAENRGHITWARWGELERRSVITRGGLLSGTRGLGQDIMSSEIDASLALVQARRAGRAERVQRYLDSENQEVPLVLDCTISRGASSRMQIGQIDRGVTEMIEACTSPERSFTNRYQVDAGGRVLQSQQWLSPYHGKVVIQALR